jgi:proteasome accessory factor B
MKHTNDLHRLLTIITLVQGGAGWTSGRLAEKFGVDERTIFRDISKLRATGVPVESAGRDGYHIRGDFFLQPVQLTPEEALALAVLCENVAETEQISFLRPAARALEKIMAQLPPDVRDDIARVAEHVHVRTAPAAEESGVADVYERVRLAIKTRRALDCVYEAPRRRAAGDAAAGATGGAAGATGADAPEPFIFRPFALFFSVRAWYAVGERSDRAELRCLKLSRFSRCQPTVRAYEIPADFSLDAYLGNAWRMIPGDREHDVLLELDAAFGETVADTRWHPTQETTERPDGTLEMRFRVSGLDEIVWWVLGLGPQCRVVQPPELAARVRDLAQRVANLYPPPAAG